jgi:hypothetical protein
MKMHKHWLIRMVGQMKHHLWIWLDPDRGCMTLTEVPPWSTVSVYSIEVTTCYNVISSVCITSCRSGWREVWFMKPHLSISCSGHRAHNQIHICQASPPVNGERGAAGGFPLLLKEQSSKIPTIVHKHFPYTNIRVCNWKKCSQILSSLNGAKSGSEPRSDHWKNRFSRFSK